MYELNNEIGSYNLPIVVDELSEALKDGNEKFWQFAKDYKKGVMDDFEWVSKLIELVPAEQVESVSIANKLNAGSFEDLYKIPELFQLSKEDLKKAVDETRAGLDDFNQKMDKKYDTEFREVQYHDLIMDLFVKDVFKYEDKATYDEAIADLFSRIEYEGNKMPNMRHLKRNKSHPKACDHWAEGRSIFDRDDLMHKEDTYAKFNEYMELQGDIPPGQSMGEEEPQMDESVKEDL